MKKINLWRVGYQVMWLIRFLVILFIVITGLAILGIAAGVVLWFSAGFFIFCLFITGWKKLQSFLLSRAKEKELADRC